MRTLRASVLASLLILLILLAAPGCTSAASTSSHPSTSTPSPSSTPSLTAVGSSGTVGSPATVAAVVGPAPTTCGGTAPTDQRFGSAIGADPVWAVGFGGDSATLRLANGRRMDRGWRVKVLIAVRMPIPEGLGLEVRRAPDRAPVFVEVAGGRPELHASLTEPPIPPGGVWAQFPSHWYLPSEGCYEMTARWQGGEWTIPFAFGR